MKMNQQKTKLVTWLIIGAIAMATTPSIATEQTIRWDKFGVPKTSCQVTFGGHFFALPGRRLAVRIETSRLNGSKQEYMEVISETGRELKRCSVTKHLPPRIEGDASPFTMNARLFTISIAEEQYQKGGRLVRSERIVAQVGPEWFMFNDEYVSMTSHRNIIQLIVRPFTNLLEREMLTPKHTPLKRVNDPYQE